MGSKANPRHKNGAARRRIVQHWRALGQPCAICGHAIDYSLSTITDPITGRTRRHPMSFVVDEIVPVSKGGSPYTIDNTRPAHWICNARRGDGRHDKPRHAPTAIPQPWQL